LQEGFQEARGRLSYGDRRSTTTASVDSSFADTPPEGHCIQFGKQFRSRIASLGASHHSSVDSGCLARSRNSSVERSQSRNSSVDRKQNASADDGSGSSSNSISIEAPAASIQTSRVTHRLLSALSSFSGASLCEEDEFDETEISPANAESAVDQDHGRLAGKKDNRVVERSSRMDESEEQPSAASGSKKKSKKKRRKENQEKESSMCSIQ
jgi:hypothetical protein